MSIGVASFPAHGSDPEALFAAADRAMYQVKRRGRDGVAVAGSASGAAMMPALDRFVGRSEELRGLVRLLDEASKGKSHTVAVLGEAGVGKTTLLRQLEPEIRLRGGSMVVGRALDAVMAQPPYGPWIEIVEALERQRQLAADPGIHPSAQADDTLQTRFAHARKHAKHRLARDALRRRGTAPHGMRIPSTPAQNRLVPGDGSTRWPELSRIVPSLDTGKSGAAPVPTGSKFALARRTGQLHR